MQSVSSRIWTRVAVSISYDDNDYTTGTSKYLMNLVSSLIYSSTSMSLRISLFLNTTVYYDWSLLNNRDIRDKYTLTLRNKFNALQISETPTPNNEYENIVNAHLETAAECIATKQRAKPKVPWETLAVRKKHADIKTTSLCNRRNPTNINALKLEKAQNEHTYITYIYMWFVNEYFLSHIIFKWTRAHLSACC